MGLSEVTANMPISVVEKEQRGGPIWTVRKPVHALRRTEEHATERNTARASKSTGKPYCLRTYTHDVVVHMELPPAGPSLPNLGHPRIEHVVDDGHSHRVQKAS